MQIQRVNTVVIMRPILAAVLLLVVPGTTADIFVPDPITECYMEEGDLTIGLLTEIRTQGEDGVCKDKLKDMYRPQIVEGFIFAMDKINRQKDILPGVQLGYIILDTCSSDITALGQVMRVVPSIPHQDHRLCSLKGNLLPYNKVVALVGFINSRQSVMVSGVLSLFHIPIVGSTASSDDLSDKGRFAYFSRIVPPDKYQTQAILDFVQYHGWTYLSLVFSAGSYGENGARQLERGAKERGICYAYIHMIELDDTAGHYDLLVQNLLSHSNAKVVILFVSSQNAKDVFASVQRLGAVGRFIWIGGDDVGDKDFGPESAGLFTVTYSLGTVDGFDEYYQNITSTANIHRPWLRFLWEEENNCSFSSSNFTSHCNRKSIKYINDAITGLVSKATDSVYTLAYALHNLMEDSKINGSNVKGNASIDGKLLNTYILNVTFDGDSGPIQFDEKGDGVGQYVFSRYNRNNDSATIRPVATWDQATASINMLVDLDWESYGNSDGTPPESRCSEPCEGRTYKVLLDVHCCWECHPCRSNEKVKPNRTGCEICPPNFWPYTAFECDVIPPTYLKLSDSVGFIMLILTIVALCFAGITTIVFIVQRQHRLIKASSLELSAIILAGIWVALSGVFVFIIKPTYAACLLNRLAFHIGASLIYAPLLVKTTRVYRIFAAGKRGVKKVSFIRTRDMLILVATVLSIEVNGPILLSKFYLQKSFETSVIYLF